VSHASNMPVGRNPVLLRNLSHLFRPNKVL
jgi:hypothetical protein